MCICERERLICTSWVLDDIILNSIALELYNQAMNLLSIKRECGQNNEQYCKVTGNWGLEVPFYFILRLIHRKGGLQSSKAQLFKKFLAWAYYIVEFWMFFKVVELQWKFSHDDSNMFICVCVWGGVFIVLSSTLHMGVVPEKFPDIKLSPTFPQTYFQLRECSVSVTHVPNVCSSVCLMLLFYFRATQMLLLCSKVTPTSTTTFIYLFRPHTGRPHPHTPKTLLPCTTLVHLCTHLNHLLN